MYALQPTSRSISRVSSVFPIHGAMANPTQYGYRNTASTPSPLSSLNRSYTVTDRTFQSGSEMCFVYDGQMRINSSRREPAEFERELPRFPEDVSPTSPYSQSPRNAYKSEPSLQNHLSCDELGLQTSTAEPKSGKKRLKWKSLFRHKSKRVTSPLSGVSIDATRRKSQEEESPLVLEHDSDAPFLLDDDPFCNYRGRDSLDNGTSSVPPSASDWCASSSKETLVGSPKTPATPRKLTTMELTHKMRMPPKSDSGLAQPQARKQPGKPNVLKKIKPGATLAITLAMRLPPASDPDVPPGYMRLPIPPLPRWAQREREEFEARQEARRLADLQAAKERETEPVFFVVDPDCTEEFSFLRVTPPTNYGKPMRLADVHTVFDPQWNFGFTFGSEPQPTPALERANTHIGVTP